ncbi:hypothetical protein OIE66_34080 [Nonomuraea sp. NBC_01738]|uniref:hypothetical protein n=1 Tax=Nonomuraea sp. NBC_01738 TaxID=2976003 RepID=UPI002E12A8FC|nr:hypothetical protein OIE66_34080 [Nonomuraea sp. NBC_01738]
MLHRRNPRHAPSTLDTRRIRLGLTASTTAVLLSCYALTRSPRGLELLSFTVFYVGVAALVTLTATVALGLVATERVFLSARNRVRAQFWHRVAALAGMAFLLVHVALRTGRPPLLGALAAGLLLVSVVSGLLRGRFAGTERPWVWRTLHSAAYLAWPISVLHGLTAGRAPAGWVAWSYVACLVAVGSALLVRVAATMLRPPAVPEVVTAARVVETEAVNAPVSLDAARRRYRRAG